MQADHEKAVDITLPVSAGTNLPVSTVNSSSVSGWSQSAVCINDMKLHLWNTGSQSVNINSGIKICCLFISF